jgi:hypothetical protein
MASDSYNDELTSPGPDDHSDRTGGLGSTLGGAGASRRRFLQGVGATAVVAGLGIGFGVGTARAAEDLTGISVAYFGGSGRQRDLLTGDLEDRGATVTPIFDATASTLANYDVVWFDEQSPSLTTTEQDDVVDFVADGGGVLLHGDNLSSSIEALGPTFGIQYGFDASQGATTDIVEDYITRDVGTVEVNAPGNSISATDPAVVLVRDVGGAGHVAKSEFGGGRVVVVADDDFFDTIITDADNRLLGNQAIDWLAGFGPGALSQVIVVGGREIGQARDLDGDGLFEDVDGDGVLDQSDFWDLTVIERAHRRDPSLLTDEQAMRFDFDGNGRFDARDVRALARFIRRGVPVSGSGGGSTTTTGGSATGTGGTTSGTGGGSTTTTGGRRRSRGR